MIIKVKRNIENIVLIAIKHLQMNQNFDIKLPINSWYAVKQINHIKWKMFCFISVAICPGFFYTLLRLI